MTEYRTARTEEMKIRHFATVSPTSRYNLLAKMLLNIHVSCQTKLAVFNFLNSCSSIKLVF